MGTTLLHSIGMDGKGFKELQPRGGVTSLHARSEGNATSAAELRHWGCCCSTEHQNLEPCAGSELKPPVLWEPGLDAGLSTEGKSCSLGCGSCWFGAFPGYWSGVGCQSQRCFPNR